MVAAPAAPRIPLPEAESRPARFAQYEQRRPRIAPSRNQWQPPPGVRRRRRHGGGSSAHEERATAVPPAASAPQVARARAFPAATRKDRPLALKGAPTRPRPPRHLFQPARPRRSPRRSESCPRRRRRRAVPRLTRSRLEADHRTADCISAGDCELDGVARGELPTLLMGGAAQAAGGSGGARRYAQRRWR